MIYEPVLVEMKNYLNNGMGMCLFAKHVKKQTATIIQHYDCCHICTKFFLVLFSQGKFHILKNQRIPMLQFSLVINYIFCIAQVLQKMLEYKPVKSHQEESTAHFSFD